METEGSHKDVGHTWGATLGGGGGGCGDIHTGDPIETLGTLGGLGGRRTHFGGHRDISCSRRVRRTIRGFMGASVRGSSGSAIRFARACVERISKV